LTKLCGNFICPTALATPSGILTGRYIDDVKEHVKTAAILNKLALIVKNFNPWLLARMA
jgi:hypothetical protein